MPYSVPILFVIYNRREIAIQTFEKIRIVQPKYLFIACDGPKVKTEEPIITAIRKEIVGMIDWDCECKILFQDVNLGCGRGVYTAINWFFNTVCEGIILEDDCVVSESFFAFMEEMLCKYRSDDRIGMIAGFNSISIPQFNDSYLFSKYKSCWGWATWRRAWLNMDINMTWRKSLSDSVLSNMGYRGLDISGWKYKIDCIDRGIVSAWDWQWYFSLALNNQLCIYPICNLVSNIGNDGSATHTSFSNIFFDNKKLNFPLKHPSFVVPYDLFDYLFYKQSNTLLIKILRIVPFGMKRKIKKCIKNIKTSNLCHMLNIKELK